MTTTDPTKPDARRPLDADVLSTVSVHLDRARVAVWVLGQILNGDLLDLKGDERDIAMWACQQWIDDGTEEALKALGEDVWAGASRLLASASRVDWEDGRGCAMTTEPTYTYNPEALAGTPLDDLTLNVAKLDAALWIFRQWESRSINGDAPDFIDGIPETEVLFAIHALVGEARDGIKEILAKYVASPEALS